MSDRELLELAAKAAGIDYWIVRFAPRKAPIEKLHTEIDGETVEWNPLTDDGDRYRLIKKLGMLVNFNSGVVYSSKDKMLAISKTDIDRAIVRAAAEIGRAMP